MKSFALIGAAGYIAPRHLKAIKETGCGLAAVLDKSDSVGVLDSFFPDADLFLEFERFDRHIDKLRRQGQKVDFISICSPNYLHDSHIRFALRSQANAICEKPLVLNPWNIEPLAEIERETGKKIYNILQLRLHKSITELKRQVDEGPDDKIYDIDLNYITGRGHWYFYSWKGDLQKSGGVATNIGIHFFDMLIWIFGDVQSSAVHISTDHKAAGLLLLKRARVRWFLSVDIDDVPKEVRAKGVRTYRAITIGNKEIEFSGGFTDLHTKIYEKILQGNGFGLKDARKSIELAYLIRNARPIGLKGDYHPFCNKISF